jgi:hypothetical protein
MNLKMNLKVSLAKKSMTVIYFTDGALIEDVYIRRSLLRIPEIIEALRTNQNEFLNCDLFIAMMDQKNFNLLNYHQKFHMKQFLQQALYKRWIRQGFEPDLILRRNDYEDFTQLTQVFSKLATLESLKVVTIGPGFDELESFLRKQLKLNSCPVIDIISQDPHLSWFWKDVKSNIQLHS